MAIFLWEGKTAQGRVVKGDNLEAPNLEAAFAAFGSGEFGRFRTA